MKRLLILSLAGAMAACSQSQPTPQATETTAPPAANVPLATDNKPITGTYEVSQADGSRKLTRTVKADGTVETVEGDKTTDGTWTSTGPGNLCITNKGDSEPTCYTEQITDNGIWIANNVKDDNDSWLIKRAK